MPVASLRSATSVFRNCASSGQTCRISGGADSDLADVYNTERHLLYVACTRTRDWLLVCGVDPASEFLDDIA